MRERVRGENMRAGGEREYEWCEGGKNVRGGESVCKGRECVRGEKERAPGGKGEH